MRFDLALLLLASLAVMAASEGGGGGGEQHKSKAKKEETPMTLRPRFLDQYAKGKMVEEGTTRTAEPECRYGLGWVYFNGNCYLFTSYHETFLNAEEACNEVGGYLADVLTQEEGTFIKDVLNVINPKDGTDYWLGGMDADRDGGMQWITGQPMDYVDFVDGEPSGKPYTHMDYDLGFAWNTKDDANDQDNGFVCKRAIEA